MEINPEQTAWVSFVFSWTVSSSRDLLKHFLPRQTMIWQLATSKRVPPHIFARRIYAARDPNFNPSPVPDPFSKTIKRHVFFGLTEAFRCG